MGSIFSIFNFVEARRKPVKSGGFNLYRPNRTTFWPRQNLSLRSTWSSRSTQRWRTWPERWANRFGCCFRMLRIGVGCFRGNTHIGIPRQHFFGNRPPATGVRQFKKSPKSSRIFAEKAPNSLLVRELEIFCCCKKKKVSKVSSAPADIICIKVATPMPHTGVRKTPKKKVFQHGRKTTKGIVL